MIAPATPVHLRITSAEDVASPVPLGDLLAATSASLPPGFDVGADESYALTISADSSIRIDAATPSGAARAVETLRQLSPATIGAQPWPFPHLTIEDRPRFPWRGVLLDVCRHLISKQDVCRFIDQLAMHKLNVLHWHLTDDQGWRIEIKRHPRLTEVGAWRRGADGYLVPSRSTENPDLPGRYGGFFTQDDVREIVAHAATRHVAIVPEIEMPGHATAALAAYPELSCTGSPVEVLSRMGIFKDVFCAGNDAVFRLLEDVLDEVIDLFPGRFIHIGGDECPRDRWSVCPKCQQRVRDEKLSGVEQLQSYFIERISRHVRSRGRTMIGWDEILEGPIPPDAAVMSWRGTEGGIAAARAGHDVVMCPHQSCYLDYRQAPEGEPPTHGPVLTLEQVYAFDPIAGLDASQARRVMGVQGNVWTEYMPDRRHVEYMTWPRACAIAEIGWSAAQDRDPADFQRRMRNHVSRLRSLAINARAIP